MKPLAILASALAMLVGLVAWRSWAHRREPAPRPLPPVPAAPAPPSDDAEGPELARVGSQVLTAKRLALWKSIGGTPLDDGALVLLEHAVKREIADRRFGIRPSTADLDAELWMRFCKDPDIHRASRASVEDVASKARENPRKFPALGPPDGRFGRWLIPLSDAASPPRGNPLPRLDPLPIDLDALSRTPAGELYPEIVDTPDAYLVLRVQRQRTGFAEVETWTIPKVPYVAWLTDQARALNGTIASPDLKSQLEALDPDHWLRKSFRNR